MFKLNLTLFDGATGGGATGAVAGTAAQPSSENGAKNNPSAGASANEQRQTISSSENTVVQSDTQIDRAAEFDKLVKGDYKAEYDKRVQDIIKSRFRETEKIKKSNDAKQALLDRIAAKYGVDASDLKAIQKAVDDDTAYFEKAAKESGQTVEQYKRTNELEAEVAKLRRSSQAQEAENAFRSKIIEWERQGEAVKQIYPTFDFRTEMQNRDFYELLNRGINVQTAYEVMHKDDIISGAMAYTAQQIHQQTVNDIKARGMRHQEGAVASQAGTQVKFDVHNLDRKGREELARRAARGERIEF